MKKEKWRNIPGWEQFYQVSDSGDVRSLTRKILKKQQSGKFGPSLHQGRKLKKRAIKNGYSVVSLCRFGKSKTFYVSRLVLLAFRGNCPENQECCHNDGSRSNDTLNNLRYDTRSANALDRIKHGTTVPKGLKNKLCKLTEKDLKWAKHEYRRGIYSLRALSCFLNVSHRTLSIQLNHFYGGLE